MTRIEKGSLKNPSFYLSWNKWKKKQLDNILKNREINILEKYTSVAPTKWDDENVNVSIENQKKKIKKTREICELILNIRAIIPASAKEKFRQMNVGYGMSCIPFLGALLTILNEHTP